MPDDHVNQGKLAAVERGEFLRRIAGIEPAGFQHLARLGARGRGEQHAVFGDRAGRHHAADADQRAVADDAVMDRDIVADRGVAADRDALRAGAADDRIVLDIAVEADGDGRVAGVEIVREPDARGFGRAQPAAQARGRGNEDAGMDVGGGRELAPRRDRFGALGVRPDHLRPALGNFAGGDRAHHPGRAAGIDMAAVDALGRKHGTAGLEDDVVADHDAVKDDGAVTHDQVAADRAVMDAGVLADRDAIPDDAGKDLVGDVQGGAGAEMEIVAGLHIMPVGADHRARAEPGIAAERDAAEHGGARPGLGERRGEGGRDARIGKDQGRYHRYYLVGCAPRDNSPGRYLTSAAFRKT